MHPCILVTENYCEHRFASYESAVQNCAVNKAFTSLLDSILFVMIPKDNDMRACDYIRAKHFKKDVGHVLN